MSQTELSAALLLFMDTSVFMVNGYKTQYYKLMRELHKKAESEEVKKGISEILSNKNLSDRDIVNMHYKLLTEPIEAVTDRVKTFNYMEDCTEDELFEEVVRLIHNSNK